MLRHFISEASHRQFQSYRYVKSPLWAKKILAYMVIVFLFILFCLAFLPWTQTSKGQGQVIAFSPNERAQTIDSPITGRLGRWHVQEGSFVKAGDPIVEIFDNDPNILERLKSEREAIIKNLQASSLAAETSKINVDRQKKLVEQGLASERDYEKSKLEYSKLLSVEAKASADLTKIDTKIARQSTQMVVAPMDGYIQRRQLGLGSQQVKSGDFLAMLVPQTVSRSVELWVGGNDLPFIHQGDKVRLQFEGWPAIQSFGWPSLARGTFGGTVEFIDTFVSENGKTRLLVRADPEDTNWPSSDRLRQGARVFGWVLLNKVSLGFEVWRNFNGFPPISTQDQLMQKNNKDPKAPSKSSKK